MSLPGVQTEKTMLAERDQQIRYKQQQKAMEEIREAEEVLKHYESYKLGGDSNQELENLLRQKRAELDIKKRALGADVRPQGAPGAAIAFDMNSKEPAAKPGRDLLFAQGGAQTSTPSIPSQESERDRRLRLRGEERARKLSGNPGSAYGSAPERPPLPPTTYAAELPSQVSGAEARSQMYDPSPLPPAAAFRQSPRTQADAYDRPPAYEPLQRQMMYSEPSSGDLAAYSSTPVATKPQKAPEEPQETGFPFGRADEDKKEKQRRYREELDRQQAEKKPPRPGRTPSMDAPDYTPPMQQPDPAPVDDKREKQRRYKEELDRMAAAKASAYSGSERDRTMSGGGDASYLPPAPYQSDRPPEDDPRIKEMEKKQRYAQELREMMDEKARLKQRESDQYTYQSAPQMDYRAIETEKKANYARQLEEQIRQRPAAMDERSGYGERPGYGERSGYGERPAYAERPAYVERPAFVEQPQDPQTQMPDPAVDKKLQYKAELQKQMEEQKRRREEEKQKLKEQQMRDEAKFLAEVSDVRKTGKKVSDPNRPSSDHPNANRYEQLLEKRKADPQDRPIGVAEPKARPSRTETMQPEPVPGPNSSTRRNLFEPASSEESRGLDLLSQYPPKPAANFPQAQGYPPSPHGFPEPQQYVPARQPIASQGYPPRQPLSTYSGPPATSSETVEQYYKEIQEIRLERDRAKNEMLELREMMLKEKENRLEEMIKLISAQAMSRPPAWPQQYAPPSGPQPYTPPSGPAPYAGGAQGYAGGPQGFPASGAYAGSGAPQAYNSGPYTPPSAAQWSGFPPVAGQQYSGGGQFPPKSAENPYRQAQAAVAQPPDMYVSPSAAKDDWKANPSPRFAGEGLRFGAEGLDALPAELFPRPAIKADLGASNKANFDFMEKSMSGSSHFVDPQSMMWGTTHLLASGQKKQWGTALEANSMSAGEMEQSLASEVTHVPVPPLEQDPPIIEQIEEEPPEREDDQLVRPSSVHTPMEPFPMSSSGSITETSLPGSQVPAPESASRPSVFADLNPLKMSDSDASRELRPRSRRELEPMKMSDSEASKGLRPRSRQKQDEIDLCNIKSGNELQEASEEFQPQVVDPPPRTSSASGRNRPKTLDVFKAHPTAAKAPAKRQVPPEKPKKVETKQVETKPQEVQSAGPGDPKPSFHRLQDVRDRKKQEKPRDVLDNLQDAIEKLNQQRQNAGDSVSLDGSSSSQTQFESRFRVLALNELKGERPPSSPKPAAVYTPASGDILDQFVESVQQTNSRPVSKSSSRRYTEEQGDI